MKTWFITGGTPGGFGLAYADAALARGDREAVTTRRPTDLAEWAAPFGERVLVLTVDVTDTAQVHGAVAEVEERFGGVDVLVNNAGRGWDGSVEGTSDEVVRRIFELNFFAVVGVLRAVLPGMRARREGSIITMSSVAGLRGIPGFGHYTAVKHAVEGLTDVLHAEVGPLGIKTLLVEPGSFRTNAYAGFSDEPVADIDDYRLMLDGVHAAMIDQDGKQPGDPRRGVEAVLSVLDETDPPQRLVLGSDGFDAATAALEGKVADLRSHEAMSRGSDFPPES